MIKTITQNLPILFKLKSVAETLSYRPTKDEQLNVCLLGIETLTSDREMDEFVRELEQLTGDYANSILGSLLGKIQPKVNHWFKRFPEAKHPIFGRSIPSPEVAFRNGLSAGRSLVGGDRL